MKLALWQTGPTDGRIDAAFSALCQQLTAAAHAGAKLLLVPELYLPGYNRPDLHATLAQPIDGAWITRLRQMARDLGCGLCLGWAERAADGAVYNAATTICQNGEILSHYRKIQLYGPMERTSFARGTALAAPFMAEDQRAAMLICYDIEFPGHVAALAKGGAQLILVPTANPMGYEHVQRVLIPARAHENRAVVAYANFWGQEGDVTYGGRSIIAGPDGEPLAMAGPRGDALLVVDLAGLAAIPEDLLAAFTTEYRPAARE